MSAQLAINDRLQERWRANAWIAAVFVLVSIGSVLLAERYIPPFQSPDEDVHLMRAAMLARGQVLLQRTDGSTRDSGTVDAEFAALVTGLANMPTETRAIIDPPAGQRVANLASLRWSDKTVEVHAAGTGYYAPVIYLPHAAGLWLGEHLGLTILDSYRLTRALVILAAYAILFYAWSLAVPNVLVLMLLATPLALFQWLSPTIDGLCNALLLLFLALWVRLSRDADSPADPEPHRRLELVLYVCIFILCTARTNLLPILIVPLIFLVRRFSWQRLAAIVILWLGTTGWIAYAALNSGDRRLQRTLSNGEILVQYLLHPLELATAIVRTLMNPDQLKFYYLSFSGILGWLNAPVSKDRILVLSVFWLLAFVMGLHRANWRYGVALRGWGCAVAATSTLLVFAALAVTYNDYPTPYIIGIQGRYFIAPAVILAFALGPIRRAHESWSRPEILVFVVYLAFSLQSMTKTLTKNYLM